MCRWKLQCVPDTAISVKTRTIPEMKHVLFLHGTFSYSNSVGVVSVGSEALWALAYLLHLREGVVKMSRFVWYQYTIFRPIHIWDYAAISDRT